mmetsp:Transcript_17569/g.40408  ORF Transcript_17569/g.40408 Transcript_17569/m.40408 type:complete len:309 (-) Transcript_17569:68-994(-)
MTSARGKTRQSAVALQLPPRAMLPEMRLTTRHFSRLAVPAVTCRHWDLLKLMVPLKLQPKNFTSGAALAAGMAVTWTSVSGKEQLWNSTAPETFKYWFSPLTTKSRTTKTSSVSFTMQLVSRVGCFSAYPVRAVGEVTFNPPFTRTSPVTSIALLPIARARCMDSCSGTMIPSANSAIKAMTPGSVTPPSIRSSPRFSDRALAWTAPTRLDRRRLVRFFFSAVAAGFSTSTATVTAAGAAVFFSGRRANRAARSTWRTRAQVGRSRHIASRKEGSAAMRWLSSSAHRSRAAASPPIAITAAILVKQWN